MIARIEDDEMTDSTRRPTASSKSVDGSPQSKYFFPIPAPVRRVFEQFPLTSYQENEIPQRAKRRRNQHTLYIFANSFDTSANGLSCNPTCLKWQSYLKFNDIEFSTVPSNNHASPSGSLPFLIPASSNSDPSPLPLTTGKIPRWTSQQTMQEEDLPNMEQEAYMSLIDQNIRNAWLYHLYLDKSNFREVAHPLYVSTASSNRFVQIAIAYQLRDAAQVELLKSRNVIEREEVYIAAEKAFRALSTLLGNEDYFSKDERPGLFDASVFAYTCLLLDEVLPWQDTTLSDLLRQYQPLVDHRNRLFDIYTKD